MQVESARAVSTIVPTTLIIQTRSMLVFHLPVEFGLPVGFGWPMKVVADFREKFLRIDFLFHQNSPWRRQHFCRYALR